MLSKINISDILRDHCATFTDADDVSSVSDWVLFYIFPLIIAGGLAWQSVEISKEAGGLLINAFAIFAGLLLNLLMLVHGLLRRYHSPSRHHIARHLLRQLYANIAYGVVISLVALVPLVIIVFVKSQSLTSMFLTFLVFFLTIHFLLTLLMTLKRVHILLRREYESPH